VTLTLSLAYLAVLTHQRNRQAQSDILRAQNSVLRSIAHDPASSPTSPTTLTQSTTAETPLFVETAKSRWNAEIESAVRWAQTKDWQEVREDVEGVLGRLWGSVSGSPVGDEVRREADAVKSRTVESVESAKTETNQAQQSTKSALEEARDMSQAAAASAVQQAKETSKSVAEAVQLKAEQGKAAVARGVEKSKEVVDKAIVAVGLAEQKLNEKVDDKLSGLSEADRALAERYREDRGDVLNKSVEEALAERYKPIDQQDHSKLRGI
jgi:altered-inheritance-of-mitochondria protein 5